MKPNKALVVAITIVVAAAVFLSLNDSNRPKGEGDKNMNTATVIIETSVGKIELDLYPGKAPVTVKNFLDYVDEGFYAGTVFHRVIPGFMVQGGGFTPDGTGKETRSPIKLESNNGLKNKVGAVAMARTNIPDSATSQFFINIADNNPLDYVPGNDGYAVFGNVTSGMDVVKKIAAVKTGSRSGNDNWPVEDIVIKKVSVKK